MQLGDRDLYNPNVIRDDMQFQYTFVLDAGHCDRKVRDQTLSEALEWARRGYRR